MSDPYVYPGTDVLRNLKNIRDAAKLERVETQYVARAIVIETQPQFSSGKPDEKAFRDIHKSLFGQLYEWAGESRTVDIAKADTYFCRAQYIDREMTKQFTALAGENHLKGLDAAKFAERAAEHVCEINAIHPFREGNGRTMAVFLQRLARHAGHDLDLQKLERGKWIEASRAGMLGDYGPKAKLITEALIPGRQQAQSQDKARQRDDDRTR